MRSAHRRLGLLLPLLLAAGAWSAPRAQFEVVAFVEPEGEIQMDQTPELVIQVAGESNPDVKTPRLPDLTNLRASGGPSRRISSNWVNGRFSARVELRYELVPQEPGAARIPPIELQVDDRSYRTEEIRLVVIAAPAQPAPRPAAPRREPSSRRDENQVFLRAEIGTDEIWVGQAVPLTVSLYSDGVIGSAAWRGQPQLSSFWVEELEVDSETEAYSSSVGGRRYIVRPLQRKVIVPQSPGEFKVEPWVLQLQIRGRGSDPFDVFSLTRGSTVIRRTETLPLTVKALPEAGRPEDFGGAVGNFRVSASLDREATAVNDAVALKVTVEGEGFLLAVAAPEFEAPAGIKLFDPEVRSTSRGDDGKLISSKSWEWILVPNTPGEVRMPALEFHYFDPTDGRYRTARHEFEPLVVRHGDETLDGPRSGGQIRLLQRDLAFIKPLDGPLQAGEPGVRERRLFVTLLALPLAWVPLWIVLGRRRARLRRDTGLARGRRAGRQARRALSALRKLPDGSDDATFHEALARALLDYVADRFDRASSGLSYETVDDLLASRGLDEDLRGRFRACLESCDFARFVPGAVAENRRADLLREAGALVEELEKVL